jgi:hypothetical protein
MTFPAFAKGCSELIERPMEWTPAYASPLLIEEPERIIRQIRVRWPKVRVLHQLSGMGPLGTCSAAWAVVIEPAADDTVRLDLMRANRPTIGQLRDIAALCRDTPFGAYSRPAAGRIGRVSDPTQRDILKITKWRPVRPVHMRRLVRFVEVGTICS